MKDILTGLPDKMVADLEKKIELRTKFQKLATEWRENTWYMSLCSEIYGHPAYRAIINLGPDVVPFILEELAQRPEEWFGALEELTGEVFRLQEPPYTSQRLADYWLEWGKTH